MYKIITLLLCIIPMLAVAKKSYPPYPDVWGYDLSDEVDAGKVISLEPLQSSNGDYYMLYNSNPPKGIKREQVSAIHFFKQTKQVFITSEQIIKYTDRQIKNSRNTMSPYVVLQDGKIIDVTINDAANLKYKKNHTPLHYQYVRRINDFIDDKITDYEISVIGISTICDTDNKCENWAYFLASLLMPLGDDTFIAFERHYPLLIRFDRDFKTKFKPQRTVQLDEVRRLKSNFYVMPYSKVKHFFEHIAKGFIGDYTDDINRQFLNYLFEEEQKGNI